MKINLIAPCARVALIALAIPLTLLPGQFNLSAQAESDTQTNRRLVVSDRLTTIVSPF